MCVLVKEKYPSVTGTGSPAKESTASQRRGGHAHQLYGRQ